MKRLFMIFLTICLCLSGCSGAVDTPTENSNANNTTTTSVKVTDTVNETEPTEALPPVAPAEDPDGETVLLTANVEYTPPAVSKPNTENAATLSDFAVELFKREIAMADKDDNTVISPLSVLYAMGMAATGATDETLSEMMDVMGAGMSIEDFNALFAYYTKNSLNDNSSLSIANSVWLRQSFAPNVEDSYLYDTVKYYKADIFRAPFNDKTKDDINAWISDNTDGEIEKMIERIPSEAVMYLINTILFDASWEVPFGEPYEGVFTTSQGDEQTVDMMRVGELMPYIESDGVQGFLKPYADNGYMFMALLPPEGTDAYDFAMSLTGEDFINYKKYAKGYRTIVTMPVFEAETLTDLSGSLKEMGINRAFTPMQAQFCGMSETFGDELYIGEVIHKARIEVDKNGTKAAAATVVQIMVGSAADSFEQEPKSVTLDRPFVYAIVDGNGNPVFIGVQNSIE